MTYKLRVLMLRIRDIIITLLLAALLELPHNVVTDMYSYPIAEWIEQKIGFGAPNVDLIVRYIGFTFPVLAAVSIVYINNKIYIPYVIFEKRKKYGNCSRCWR